MKGGRRRFTVVMTHDPEGRCYSASVPALPGCHTWGRTRKLAFENALDAIHTYLEAVAKLGKAVPREVGRRTAIVG